METREHRSAEKKRRLLDAAERIYYRDGDLGLTVRRLANEASTTSQTIYTYFGSRDAVISAMYERVLGELDRLVDSLEGQSTTPSTALPTGGTRTVLANARLYRRHVMGRPAHLRMLITGTGPEGTDPAEIERRRDRLVGLVGRPGRPSAPVPNARPATVVFAAVNGFVEAELHGLLEPSCPAEQLLTELVSRLTAT